MCNFLNGNFGMDTCMEHAISGIPSSTCTSRVGCISFSFPVNVNNMHHSKISKVYVLIVAVAVYRGMLLQPLLVKDLFGSGLPVAVPCCQGRVTEIAASILFSFHYVYAVYHLHVKKEQKQKYGEF